MANDCPRCDYRIGLFTTRCGVCGEKVPRARIMLIGTACMSIGLGIGCAVMHFFHL